MDMSFSGLGSRMKKSLEPCNFPQLNKAHVTPAVDYTAFTHLSSNQTTQLYDFCQQREIEVPILLQAAWAQVLRCYIGSDSVLFRYCHLGSPSTGHNGLVCGDQFDVANTVAQHLERVVRSDASSSTCWVATEGQDDDSTDGLFNTLVTFRESMQADSGAREDHNAEDVCQYAISVNFEKSEVVLSLKLKHDSFLLDEMQGQHLANTTRSALLKIIAEPFISIGELDLIDKEDMKQILEWNHAIPEESKICAHHILERQARTTRNSQAICSWDGDMTYAELDKLSSALGGHLSSRGVGPDVIVPICFEKCRWTIVAMMAVLKAGGAFATMDPAQPINRLKDTIQETRSKMVLVGSSEAERFEGGDWEVLTNISELCQHSSVPRYSPFSLSVDPSNLAYIAFTSGSTGKPKGVAHSHIGACANMKLKARDGQDSGYGPEGRILQFASQAFAASVLEILKTLGSGGCICIPSEAIRLNNITQFMTEKGITRAFFTPSLLKLFKPEMLSSLKILLVGGEPILPDLIETWAGKLRLIEAIGMTEGVAIQTEIKSDGQMSRNGQTLSGAAWIVDPEDYNKLMPIGAIGELLVEGPCLAKGYLNDDEKTCDSFVEAPQWATTGDHPGRKFRLYRTGDLARYFNDGVVRLLGRKDNRVKLYGQRIELGDVEHHMQNSLPESMAVAADVVTPFNDKDKAFLVGFVFASTELGKPNDPQAGEVVEGTREKLSLLVPTLKQQMALSLPAYMVPTVFIPLERRPTNTSGKVDRKILRQVASGLSTQQLMSYNKAMTQNTAPSTPMEKTIQSLWANVFGVKAEKLGLEDNFFMYGGDSLRAMKLVGLSRAEGILLTTSDILRNPTLGAMSMVAKAMEKVDLQEETKRKVSCGFQHEIEDLEAVIEKHDIEEIGHATDWQAWATYTGLLKTRGWANYMIFDFKGPLDIPRLERACSHIIKHFPIFRTVFFVHRRRVLQVVLKNHPFVFHLYDAARNGGIQATSRQLYNEDMASIASLGEPLVRFMLLKQDLLNNRLLMRASHAQFDVVSLYGLFRAIGNAYNGLVLQPSPKFIDFVNAAKENEVKSETFWRDLLKGAKMSQVLHRARPSYSNVLDQSLARTIPVPSMQHYSITTASIILAAWSIVLSKISGQSDVVFGNITSGRHSTTMLDVQEVAGPCLNVNPVRTQLSPTMTVLELLQQVQTRQLDSLDYENLGFRHIIERCTEWPSWTRFSTVVNYVHIDDEVDAMFSIAEDLKFEFDLFDPVHDKSDLWLQTKEKGKSLEVELGFCGVISKVFARDILQSFCEVVERFSSAIGTPLSSVIETKELPQLPLSSDATASPDRIHSLVKASWAQILFAEVEDFENANIEMRTPFYHVWGDLLGAAALCKAYRENGFDICVEDIVDNPSMEMQVQLLAMKDMPGGA